MYGPPDGSKVVSALPRGALVPVGIPYLKPDLPGSHHRSTEGIDLLLSESLLDGFEGETPQQPPGEVA